MQLISELDFADSDFMDFIAEQESQEVHTADHWREDLIYRLANPICADGIKLPWPKHHDKVRLRESEVSIWFGKAGSYKSTIVNQIALYATSEVKVGIMSFEMPVDVTLQRITMAAAGTEHPPASYAHKLLDYLSDKMWIYDHLDSVAPTSALACIHYMARIGIKLIVLDCLIKIKGVTRDAEKEAWFMDKLTALAKAHKIHIALVHHPRKGSSDSNPNKILNGDDMRGAGDLYDLASLVVIVHNNKVKKTAINKQEKGIPLTKDEEDSLDMPCQVLKVDKQRNNPFTEIIGLSMNRNAMQFTESPNQKLFMEF